MKRNDEVGALNDELQDILPSLHHSSLLLHRFSVGQFNLKSAIITAF
jgi:hypothetical protein